MLLLFKPAVGSPAAAIGITCGLVAAGSLATAAIGISLTLNAPTSIELQVTAVPDIHFGLSGISIGFLTRTASVGMQLGIQAAGGFGGTASPSILMGLSGTVGSFFDGGAVTLGTVFGLSGATAPSVAASLPINFAIVGVPTITGGTVTPSASTGIVLGLAGMPILVGRATADIALTVNGVGVILAPPPVTIASMALSFESDTMRLFFRKK